jgi:hypothetical protein
MQSYLKTRIVAITYERWRTVIDINILFLLTIFERLRSYAHMSTADPLSARHRSGDRGRRVERSAGRSERNARTAARSCLVRLPLSQPQTKLSSLLLI